jgi:hypothetical protein
VGLARTVFYRGHAESFFFLTSPPPLFGHAVAVSGDTTVIGAYDNNVERGAAYVFARSAGVWMFCLSSRQNGREETRHGERVARVAEILAQG